MPPSEVPSKQSPDAQSPTAVTSPLPPPMPMKSYPVTEFAEAIKASPSLPIETTIQSELLATIIFPAVVLNPAKVSRFASYAWVSAPMVRPKFPMAVEVEFKSVRLLETCANAESAADML